MRRFILPILLAVAGLILFGQGAYIRAKALLAQVLLERAFEKTVATGRENLQLIGHLRGLRGNARRRATDLITRLGLEDLAAKHIGGLSGGSRRRVDLAASLVGDPSVANPSVAQWFNPAAFAIPAKGTFGNSGRNNLRGPGIESVDFSIGKNFRIPLPRESGNLQIRFDALNVLNHPNYDIPNAGIGVANAGERLDHRDVPPARQLFQLVRGDERPQPAAPRQQPFMHEFGERLTNGVATDIEERAKLLVRVKSAICPVPAQNDADQPLFDLRIKRQRRCAVEWRIAPIAFRCRQILREFGHFGLRTSDLASIVGLLA